MKALIIGGAGFVGGYLGDHLHYDCGWSVYTTKLPHEKIISSYAEVLDLNILNIDEIESVLTKVEPDYIFHLAAQSSVALSWENPGLTVDVNIKGAVNLMDAVRTLDYKPRILLIGSGEEYGYINESETPIKEDNRLRPGNIYAATKVCQNMLGQIYTKAYDMDIIMVRAFNHIGPGQDPRFVVSDFCKQAAEIEAGIREPVMKVGNLSAKRDFTDVRDVVKAYSKLVQKGKKGETYNVGSGKAVAIQQILDKILELSAVKIEISIDTGKIRPIDIPLIEADTDKLKLDTGWEPVIPLELTIKNTLDYWSKFVPTGVTN